MITLGIIGIIAAMTIPNLISRYRKLQAETGAKVAFSILSNAITMAKSEHGSIEQMVEYCRMCVLASKQRLEVSGRLSD